MKSFFSSAFFAGNRRRLREAVNGDAPIVVAANGLLQRGSIDSAYRFFQDANFWYLTGIDEPDIVLVMDGADEYLIVPARSERRTAFDGSVDHGPLAKRSGIAQVMDETAGWQRFGGTLEKTSAAAMLPALPAYADDFGIYANPARKHLAEKVRSLAPETEMTDIGRQLARLRMVKQPEELAAMQRAVDITVKTIKEIVAPSQLATYAHEYEIEADLSRGFRRQGADGHSFDPIVAGGKRACTLHNVANGSPLKKGELLIIDTGAEVEHYAADITRTVSYGKATPRQKAVHEAVQDVQRFALGLLKPGAVLKDYEQQVHDYMGERLIGLGLGKTKEDVRRFYPHGTSHFIGLNVHDAGEYDKPLPAGAVVSCEPGIYIPEEGIGVRIEDDVLITGDGNRVLTAALPRGL